jgi:hypothetical protein
MPPQTALIQADIGIRDTAASAADNTRLLHPEFPVAQDFQLLN